MTGMDGAGAVELLVDATIGTLVVGTGGRGASDEDGEETGGAGGTVNEVIVSLGVGGDTMAGVVNVGVTDMSVAACPVVVVSVSGEVDDERVRLPCEREVERRGVPILVGVNGEVGDELNGLVLLFPIGACRELLGVIPTGEPMVVDADVDVPFCQPGITVGVVGVVGAGFAAIFHVSASRVMLMDPWDSQMS